MPKNDVSRNKEKLTSQEKNVLCINSIVSYIFLLEKPHSSILMRPRNNEKGR
jgi:hypothetical protein